MKPDEILNVLRRHDNPVSIEYIRWGLWLDRNPKNGNRLRRILEGLAKEGRVKITSMGKGNYYQLIK